MPYYRIYRISPIGRVAEAADIECSHDDEALSQATAVFGPNANSEVWQGRRLVKTRALQAAAIVRGLGGRFE